MGREEKTLWNHKYSERSHSSLEPDPFLVSAYSEFMDTGKPGTALDVAGGVGRHSLWLAERGWQVTLVDISEVGVELAKQNFAALPASSRFQVQVQDLQAKRNLGRRKYDLILVFFYLQRSLFPALISALKPGGFLVYKTYTVEQQRFRGGPSHPLHLLKPNELLRAFPSLRILYYRETIHTRGVAELVAAKSPKSLLSLRKLASRQAALPELPKLRTNNKKLSPATKSDCACFPSRMVSFVGILRASRHAPWAVGSFLKML